MDLRSFMTFDASDPTVSDDETPPGLALTEWLAEGVGSRGLQILKAVGPHGSYGWYFVVEGAKGQPVWCMLQLSDKWLLISEAKISAMKRLFGGKPDGQAHRRVCEALHAVAIERPEISNVRWFTEREFQSQAPGGDRP